jgi:hypothetical protein
VPATANRCPHCWAALSEHVTDFCPHCRRSLVVNQKRRRGETPKSGGEIPPPAAPAPYEPYQPYEPYDHHRAAPAQPLAAPADDAMAAASVRGGVAVAERDPVEFPGTPLPPGFFDALPEKARNRTSRRIPTRAIGVMGIIVVGAVGGAVRAADRNEDLSSPARYLVKGACAEYRGLTTRLSQDADDVAATGQLISWFQNNVGRFAEAARLDPELAKASDVVAWFDRAIAADFAPIDALSDDELEALEDPLVQACYNGVGRA